jgi:hypothetical protein
VNRRDFLRLVGLGAAGAALAATIDPEQLLWVPGAKTFFLPPARPVVMFSDHFSVGDLFTIEGRYAINPLTLKSTGHLQSFIVTGFTEGGSVNVAIHPQAEFWPPLEASMAADLWPKRKNWEAKPLPWLQ